MPKAKLLSSRTIQYIRNERTENNQEWTTNAYHERSTSLQLTDIKSVPAFNHLLSSTIFPAGLFILCLPASSPGSVQRKENMKVKSVNFTSAKAHNFHVLPLTSIHKLHFSCARHILTLVLLAMPVYITSFMSGEHLAPLCIQSPAPLFSSACHTSSG